MMLIYSLNNLLSLPGKFSCIPSTEEKYISFSEEFVFDKYYCVKNGKMRNLKFEIRFIDSFQVSSKHHLLILYQICNQKILSIRGRIFNQHTDLITRKGVFPYDYVSSLEKLDQQYLPPKEEFYSKLNDEDISDEDYQHALNVWDTFECKTLRDYHDLYLKSDVLLLSDVFENFR